jgi:mRNA interferase HigB
LILVAGLGLLASWMAMHIISRKVLRAFSQQHPDSRTALDTWFRIMETNDFPSFHDLHQAFARADMVGNLIVFNIGGNKYRLIAAIHFNRQKVYIRHILTHEEYDRGAWKQ